MGRLKKNTVQSSTAQDVAATVARVAKKLREFNLSQVQSKVQSAYVSEDAADTVVLDNATVATLQRLTAENKLTVDAAGTYKIVLGKRGRPRKVVQDAGKA